MDITNLATTEEIKELNVALQSFVKYRLSFQMGDTQFYKITGPAHHPHIGSDLSLQGMKEWRIIP